VIYISKPFGNQRFIAQWSERHRQLLWSVATTGLAKDLQRIEAGAVPEIIRRRIYRAHYRTLVA
jgi:hypothetical protein